MKTAEAELPPSDRTETPEKPKVKTYHCDVVVRTQLIELSERDGWSNTKLASKIGVSSSLISQYLNEAGCTYPGDVRTFERKALDFLKNESRRRVSGVETLECLATREMATAFEYIRKTNDLGAIIAESGDGKTRGIEPYTKANPTVLSGQVRSWNNSVESQRTMLFTLIPHGDYDNRTNRMEYSVKKMRGSDRLFIIDDAHRLSQAGLRFWMDFHDETHNPVALVGTYLLIDLLERDPQLFSRVGLKWEIGKSRPKELLAHLIKSQIPNVNGEFGELMALCEQVATNAGHFRAVSKQLKLAVEMRETSTVFKDWVSAFRSAHTKMHRSYKLT